MSALVGHGEIALHAVGPDHIRIRVAWLPLRQLRQLLLRSIEFRVVRDEHVRVRLYRDLPESLGGADVGFEPVAGGFFRRNILRW